MATGCVPSQRNPSELTGCFVTADRGMDGRDGCDQGAHVGVEPFVVEVPQATLDDLAERLARARWAGSWTGPAGRTAPARRALLRSL